MGSPAEFWECIAPYLSHTEDNFLNLENIRKLLGIINDPVLVVGAGQGLLVEELRKNGHTVDGIDKNPKMIEHAKDRRGIELIQADATSLPFGDNSYGTTVIATGVVDFMDDEQLIKGIIEEAVRVTVDTGCVLVSFYKVHSASESFQKRIGLITDDNHYRQQYAFNMLRQTPREIFRTIKKDANIGMLSAIARLIQMQLLLPKREREIADRFSKMVKNMDDPDAFIASCPELLPYRTPPIIHALLAKLGFNISDTYAYDSCTVVQIENNKG
jgi:ubiquinone/menaquinone biosynthesis C-methylase UbiE